MPTLTVPFSPGEGERRLTRSAALRTPAVAREAPSGQAQHSTANPLRGDRREAAAKQGSRRVGRRDRQRGRN